MKQMIFARKPKTQAQINKLFKLLDERLKDVDLSREPLRHILDKGGKDLIDTFVTILTSKVNSVTIFTRQVEISRRPSWVKIMKAAGRLNRVEDYDTLNSMPKPLREHAVIVFFNTGQEVNDDQLENEYKQRGLIPIDPYSLAVANQLDPTLADKYPNGTHWKCKNDHWSYVAFHSKSENEDTSSVYVMQHKNPILKWGEHWWFAGTLERV